MAKGYLQIHVYADNLGQPVENAKIIITGNGVNINVTTDSSGRTNLINLECPSKEYTMYPQKEIKPYADYIIKASKEGLNPITVKGVEIFADETSIQNIYMHSEPSANPPEQIIEIGEHVLWGNYPPKIVVDPDSQIPTTVSGDVLPFPIVPEYVIVHDGLPSNTTAPNYYEFFTDYIKNVASSEIYSTWPLESIKANVYAILSFTMNRIYSEWYRSKGYFFTITSTTQFDQKYIYNRTIFLSISQVVDSVFDEYITRVGRNFPFFAQYNDGKIVSNPGWLSQWGSKDLADKGYTSLNILKYYYGNDIYLDTAKVIEGSPFSFPGFNLSLNICGDAVQKIQTQLNVITSSFTLIPRIYPADGKYKESTKLSVEAFQETFDMPITGVVDFATWYKISLVYISVSDMLKERYDV